MVRRDVIKGTVGMLLGSKLFHRKPYSGTTMDIIHQPLTMKRMFLTMYSGASFLLYLTEEELDRLLDDFDAKEPGLRSYHVHDSCTSPEMSISLRPSRIETVIYSREPGTECESYKPTATN